jgi:hypothetical protein
VDDDARDGRLPRSWPRRTPRYSDVLTIVAPPPFRGVRRQGSLRQRE